MAKIGVIFLRNLVELFKSFNIKTNDCSYEDT